MPTHLRGKELVDSWRQGPILLADDVGTGDIAPRLMGVFTRADRTRGVYCRVTPFSCCLMVKSCNAKSLVPLV
jgi:hypothetical protein